MPGPHDTQIRAGDTIVLPEAPAVQPKTTFDRLGRAVRRVELVLAAVAVVFAFLCGSFVARNADVWMHLATGRTIADEGSTRIGTEPFTYTAADRYWVNHSWLYDLVSYKIFQIDPSGRWLVLLKAGLLALLAGVLIAVRRKGERLWVPAVCTLLAVLVMSPRLLLQPAVFSFLFLGLTTLILSAGAYSNRLWLLPPLFALWVNLDEWFLLGPTALALFLLGHRRSPGSAIRRLAVVLTVGLVACLVNPHTIFAFRLPAELSPSVLFAGFSDDPRFARIWDSPWRLTRYLDTSSGLSAAGLAYFVLLGVGLFSFAKCRAALRDWRLPLWVGFALLGAVNLRTVPFFAVVAAPISALNLQDLLALRGIPNPAQLHRALKRGLIGRSAALLGGVLLLTLCWLGWLQATPHESRRTAWRVQPDASLKAMGETFKYWTDRGWLRDGDRVFVTSPEAGAYLAWHCRKLRTNVDTRLPLFARRADDFLAACRSFTPAGTDDDVQRRDAFLNEFDVHVVVAADASIPRNVTMLDGTHGADPERWPLLGVAGRTVILGRNAGPDPHRWPWDQLRLDLSRLAYGTWSPAHPNLTRKVPTGPVEPTRRTLLRRLTSPADERSADTDAAAVLLGYFDNTGMRRQRTKDRAHFLAVLVDMVGAAGGTDGRTALTSATARFCPLWPVGLGEAAPHEAAIVAIRAARRALATNPNDSAAWFTAGQGYYWLWLRTSEGAWGKSMRLLDMVRHVQAATALEHAVELRPGMEQAHLYLANLYREGGFLDAALDHRKAELAATRSAGARPGETAEQTKSRLDNLENVVRSLERDIQERQNKFALQAASQIGKPLDQARTALTLGLGRKALDDILLKSEVRLFGIEGARLQLDLQLMLGRATQVGVALAEQELDENRQRLQTIRIPTSGAPNYPQEYALSAYEWFSALQSLALGGYEKADASLRAVDTILAAALKDDVEKYRAQFVQFLTTDIGFMARPELFLYRVWLVNSQENMMVLMRGSEYAQVLRADLHALLGIQALESGDPDKAREYFRTAQKLSHTLENRPRPFAGSGPAAVLTRRIETADWKRTD